MKLGRNDKCHCGSGKKYKKCHLDKENTGVPIEVMRYFQRKNAEHEMLRKAGIHIPLVPPILFKEMSARAFGRKVYSNRPVEETFHMFLIAILQEEIGISWWIEQQSLPPADRHFIAICFEKFQEWIQKNNNTAKRLGKTNIWAAKPDGYSKSLLLLAFDVVSLSHMQKLPDSLLERLKSRNEYQGARYEIAIAAIFARLGCEITFTDEKSIGKRCEFIAKHSNGFILAVEVKSRHREGVLHETGNQPEQDKLLSASAVWRLFKDALEQNPKDVPFAVFIDINSPLTPNIPFNEKPWVKEVKELVEDKLKNYPPEEYPLNAAFFTNFSYHYQTEKEAQQGEMIGVVVPHPKFPSPDPEFFGFLEGALNHYGFVPPVEFEKNSSDTGIPTIYD